MYINGDVKKFDEFKQHFSVVKTVVVLSLSQVLLFFAMPWTVAC